MDERKLRNYLLKCELQYRADHAEQAIELDWLEPHCGNVEDIQRFLREIGFRIREVMDEMEDGTSGWVVTTSGVIVYVNHTYSRGLFFRAAK